MVVIVIASQMMQQVRMRRRWWARGRSGVQRGYAAGERADECDEHGWTVGYTPGVIRPGVPVRGWFITIEGPEGAGKTTQSSALATHLRETGLDVHLTREPGAAGREGGPFRWEPLLSLAYSRVAPASEEAIAA